MADDILDGGPAPVMPGLDDLISTQPLTIEPSPVPATRNQAAITSLVATPDASQDSYNTILAENQQGSSQTSDLLKNQARAQAKAQDTQSLMAMLADKTVPIEQKQAVVNNFQVHVDKADTSTILHTNLLTKASDGESTDGEAARISTADMLGEISNNRAQIQSIVNGFKDKADNTSLSTQFFDAAAGLIPFHSAIITDKVLQGVAAETGIPRPWWETFKTYAMNGSTIRDLQQHVATLLPQQQLAFAKVLSQSVQNHTGFLFGNDNQHEAYEFMNKVFNTESYGNGSEFLDNLGSVMDLAGVGAVGKDLALGARNIRAAISGAKGPLNGEEAQQFARANANTPSNVRAEPTGTAAGVVNDVAEPSIAGAPVQNAVRSTAQSTAPVPSSVPNPGVPQVTNPQIIALQNEKADLLGRVGNGTQKGDTSVNDSIAQVSGQSIDSIPDRTKQLQSQGMKFKDAQAQATKEIGQETSDQAARLDSLNSQKAAQVDAEAARSRLDQIDSHIAQLSKDAPTVPAVKNKISEAVSDTIDRIRIQSATHEINPNSPMEIAQNANPTSARGFHEAIVKGADEVSDALAGVPQEQAIVNNVVPQVSKKGTVFTRVNDIDKNLRADQMDPSVTNLVNETSVNGMTNFEKASARSKIVNDFEQSTGLKINDAMTSFTHNGGRTAIQAVYEVPGGSFASATQARDQAAHALRYYGVEPSDIQILRKNGVSHEPVDAAAEHLPEGDYKIAVKANHEISNDMLDENSKLTVRGNLTDRWEGTTSTKHGSLSRYLLDAGSMLDRKIVGSAAVAKDYVARFQAIMIKKANQWSDAYQGLANGEKGMVDDYIREANFKGIDFDQADLAARGFNAKQVDVVSKWRDFWDNHYDLENLDVVRSLRNNGFQYFKNTNAELYARPIGKARNVSRFYDPASDTVRGWNAGEMDDLYLKGGSIAKLRRPANFGGETVEHMITRNTPTEALRGLKDTDSVLNKRPGYYTITYKSAKFIDEVDQNGAKIRTVAVAGDTKEAENFAARQRATNPGTLYRVRNDERGMRSGSDEQWDVNSAGGRIAQRHRGQLLEDASAPNMLGDMKYIENPAASAQRAAQSISGRTVMRPMLENAATRFVKQYGDVLPKDKFTGEARFPGSMSEIGRLGEHDSKQVADARTTYEYLNYLRQGYVNSLDEGTKAIFNTLADELGAKGLTGLEKTARAVGEFNPTQKLRKTVFAAYLATNPFRQILVQGIQGFRAAAYNPQGFLSGRTSKLMMEYYNHHFLSGAETDFARFIDKSGLDEAIKHHNLTASSLTSLKDANSGVWAGVKNAGNTVINTGRSIGFDQGERANIVSHAAAVYDRYKSLGRNLKDQDVAQQAHDEIRALTYDMNAAGDMPYNNGTAGILLQFLQMPHKAFLQYTGRGLDWQTKAKMAVGDALLWGVPIESAYKLAHQDFMPDQKDDKVRELVTEGAISMGYNHLLNQVFPGTSKQDFSVFNPYQLDGWMKMFTSMGNQGFFKGIANSPAYSLIAKDGSRFQNVYSQMASVFAPQPYDNRNTPEKFLATVSAVADLSSGWSNAHKAYLMTQAGEKRNQYGDAIDKNTTTGDSIATLFGFSSQQSAYEYKLSTDLSEASKSHKDDVLQVYKDIKRFYSQEYASNPNPDFKFMTDTTGAALQYYKNDPAALEIIQHQMSLDLAGQDNTLARNMLRSMNLPGWDDYLTKIDKGPWDDKTKQQMREALQSHADAQKRLDNAAKEFN